MNGMITTDENYNMDEVMKKLKAYSTGDEVSKVSCHEKKVLPGDGYKVALLDLSLIYILSTPFFMQQWCCCMPGLWDSVL